MKATANATMANSCAATLSRLYREAASGAHVPAAKIAAIWAVGSEIPKDFDAIPRTDRGGRYTRARLFALLVTVFVALDKVRLDSGLHTEPTHSRVARWSESEAARIERERLAADTEGFEDLAVLRSDFEAFAASGSTDFEAGQLVADSHGFQVLDDDRLSKLEAQAERAHRMATVGDLLDDGCAISERTGRLVHKGLDFADAVRDEVGPWLYTFETEDGEPVQLGYQGTDGAPRCPLCDARLDKDGDCLDCGYNPRWDNERTAWSEENDSLQRVENGYLADERRARGDRFTQEFETAASCAAEDLVREYRGAWVRYRARQLAIGRALPSAPAGHGLWGHVWLSKAQWAVIESVYAARAQRTATDKFGRPNIARERFTKKDVLAWAQLSFDIFKYGREAAIKRHKERK